MKKLLLTLALLVGMTGMGFADKAFEAAHPRDDQGRFIDKDVKEAETPKKSVWKESDHPRDELGRFVSKEQIAACPELKGASVSEATMGIVIENQRPVEFDVQTPRNEEGDRVKKSLTVGETTTDAYFSFGPLDLNVPFVTGKVVYMYDFAGEQNLVGTETPFATLWGKFETTIGVVTSLQGEGTPFLGGNILMRNMLDKVVKLPEDFSLGAFGGYNFRTNEPMYGLKASLRIWAI